MLNVGALQLVSIWFRSFDYWEFYSLGDNANDHIVWGLSMGNCNFTIYFIWLIR